MDYNDMFKVVDGEYPQDLEFFISVAMHGLIYVSKYDKKLISAKERPYGITYDRSKKKWLYAGGFDGEFVYFDKDGEVDKIKLDNSKEAFYNVHQIDFIGEDLWTMCGGDRTIRILDVKNGFKIKKEIVPMPKDYSHMNSVFMYNNTIYIVAHNKTFYSGVQSQLAELDMNLKVKKVRNNMGHSSHNFYTNGKEDFWCDSYPGLLMRNRKVFFKADDCYLTRGLSVSDKYIIVGGSRREKDSLKRLAESMIYILDRKGKQLCKMKILPKSFVLEIRQIQPTCLTITNNNAVV